MQLLKKESMQDLIAVVGARSLDTSDVGNPLSVTAWNGQLWIEHVRRHVWDGVDCELIETKGYTVTAVGVARDTGMKRGKRCGQESPGNPKRVKMTSTRSWHLKS